jgi:hypothetical protein
LEICFEAPHYSDSPKPLWRRDFSQIVYFWGIKGTVHNENGGGSKLVSIDPILIICLIDKCLFLSCSGTASVYPKM